MKYFVVERDKTEIQVFTANTITLRLRKAQDKKVNKEKTPAKMFKHRDGSHVKQGAAIRTEGKGCAIKHFLKNSDGSKTPVFTMSSRDAKLKKGDNREHLQETAAKKRKHVEITDNLSDSKTPQKKN